MNSEHRAFGRADEGLVICKVYGDGDVVICHGPRGNCENIADVSGYGPLMDMCDRLDVPSEFEEDIIDFVRDNTEVWD
jgi:hypothetical protein